MRSSVEWKRKDDEDSQLTSRTRLAPSLSLKCGWSEKDQREGLPTRAALVRSSRPAASGLRGGAGGA
ncbi:hypothetical protein ONE63_011189 [Megalurothrips usitatus]|uniref:Uncharacterized protein n=1 Tax=Megalurothrips usitatus TaxID=439358 RepID=A0AAV7WZZ0_9NEOP|nr:hypothetical protein ONE63_011189 [Megalurothrips usitatus]